MLTTLVQWLNASRPERERGVQACLARIEEMDPVLHAWAQVEPQPATGRGPLSGIPFGAKDIFETRGLRTEFGSPLYRGRVSSEDAAIVRELRQRGAILLGKTHTAAFAHRTPAPTRNPWNLAHTPGGSSSGSAAAVAAGMVPLALGSQTKGSVLRPASYCGVTGFKPTYGLISTEGVLPLAVSLDTVGFFTHSPADMLALWELLDGGLAPPKPQDGLAPPKPQDGLAPPKPQDGLAPPKPSGEGGPDSVFGVPERMPGVDSVMAQAFQDAVDRLRAAGASIQPVDITRILVALNDANDTVMVYEGAQVHRQRYDEFGSQLDEIAELVRRGLQVSDEEYGAAKASIDTCRAEVAETYKAVPIILVPAATGPAPSGLASTGDARMNAPWTTLGTPAVSIPMRVGGLPLGLQLTAAHGQDGRLLRAAVQVGATLTEA